MPYTDQQGSSVRIKHSSVAGEVLHPDALRPGELAINYADGIVYFRGPGGSRGKIDLLRFEPYWRSANSETWQAFSDSLARTISSGTVSDEIAVTTGDDASGNGAILHPNGKVYFFSAFQNATTTRAFEVDVDNQTQTQVSDSGEQLYPAGCALLPDGDIFICPYGTSGVQTQASIYNVDTGEFRRVGPAWDYRAFYHCGSMSNGDVVLSPRDSNIIAIYRWKKGTFDVIDPPAEMGAKGGNRGGVQLPDGRYLIAPYSSGSGPNQAYLLDEAGTVASTVAGFTPGGAAVSGATLLPDGRVLFRPFNSTTGQIFDPSDDSVTPTAAASSTVRMTSAALLPDGTVCGAPFQTDTAIKIYDPVADSWSQTSTAAVITSTYWNSAVAVPDGRVVFVPDGPAEYSRIFGAASGGYSQDVLMSAFFNGSK